MAQNILPDALFGTTVYDKDGDKIGKVDEVYLDNASGQPEWVSVKTGLFGSSLSLIPLARPARPVTPSRCRSPSRREGRPPPRSGQGTQ